MFFYDEIQIMDRKYLKIQKKIMIQTTTSIKGINASSEEQAASTEIITANANRLEGLVAELKYIKLIKSIFSK